MRRLSSLIRSSRMESSSSSVTLEMDPPSDSSFELPLLLSLLKIFFILVTFLYDVVCVVCVVVLFVIPFFFFSFLCCVFF